MKMKGGGMLGDHEEQRRRKRVRKLMVYLFPILNHATHCVVSLILIHLYWKEERGGGMLTEDEERGGATATEDEERERQRKKVQSFVAYKSHLLNLYSVIGDGS